MERMILLLMVVVLMSCHRGTETKDSGSQQEAAVATDSRFVIQDTAVLAQRLFDSLKKEKQFLRDLAVWGETGFNWNFDPKEARAGDLDQDGLPDLILPFTVESRGGGNNADFHWAVLLNKGGHWIYKGEKDLGGIFLEYAPILIAIDKDGIIKAKMETTTGNQSASYLTDYVYKDEEIRLVFSEIHYFDDGSESLYLTIYGITDKDFREIPVLATENVLKDLLGIGKFSYEKRVCCTYFEDSDPTKYLDFPFLKFEIGSEGEAAVWKIKLKDSGLRLQTNRGTLTEKTTVEEFLDSFVNPHDLFQSEETEPDESVVYLLPACEDCDNLWLVKFDSKYRLKEVDYFIQP